RRAHGHAADPRYNAVVPHAVLRAGAAETPLASGEVAPVVVLRPSETLLPVPLWRWPCGGLPERLGPAATPPPPAAPRRARVATRAAALERELASAMREGTEGRSPWAPPDRVLFVALAEALGYGRDRAALRAAGERLAAGAAPDAPLAEPARMARVERMRL